jgi:hypothetical protein
LPPDDEPPLLLLLPLLPLPAPASIAPPSSTAPELPDELVLDPEPELLDVGPLDDPDPDPERPPDPLDVLLEETVGEEAPSEHADRAPPSTIKETAMQPRMPARH